MADKHDKDYNTSSQPDGANLSADADRIPFAHDADDFIDPVQDPADSDAREPGEADGDKPKKPKKHLIKPTWLRRTLKTLLGIIIFILLIPVLIYSTRPGFPRRNRDECRAQEYRHGCRHRCLPSLFSS